MVGILGLRASPSQLCKLLEITAAFSKQFAGSVFTAFKVPYHSALKNLELVPPSSSLTCVVGQADREQHQG